MTETQATYFSPQPKEIPIRLHGKAKQKFRLDVCKRAGSHCETCGAFAPISLYGKFELIYCGHVSHVKGYGAGGGDTMDNTKWECWDCHIIIKHGPRWSGGNP